MTQDDDIVEINTSSIAEIVVVRLVQKKCDNKYIVNAATHVHVQMKLQVTLELSIASECGFGYGLFLTLKLKLTLVKQQKSTRSQTKFYIRSNDVRAHIQKASN